MNSRTNKQTNTKQDFNNCRLRRLHNIEVKSELEEGFNPFYDSIFLISLEDGSTPDRRRLVELFKDELIRLRNEIDYIIRQGRW